MSRLNCLPDRQTVGYYLLELIAVSGEFPTEQLDRLPGGSSYKINVVKSLKQNHLIRTYYRDGLRGLRLTGTAKKLLLLDAPERFSFALTGSAETNHIKSEITRRIRLHRIAQATVTMQNADIDIYRDEKPPVFLPEMVKNLRITSPAFYNSREIKEYGATFVKIKGARSVGVLLGNEKAFVVYNLGNTLMKWEYKSEMRTKALMKTVLCRERLPEQYSPEDIDGLILADSMETAYSLLADEGGKQYFVLDGNYEHFHFITNDRKGEHILKLLYDRDLNEQLQDILMTDLYSGNTGATLENDALDESGNPVLFAYTCDLPRIKRFDTALRLQSKCGTVICFDFQKEALARYCGKQITFQTISYEKWERNCCEK